MPTTKLLPFPIIDFDVVCDIIILARDNEILLNQFAYIYVHVILWYIINICYAIDENSAYTFYYQNFIVIIGKKKTVYYNILYIIQLLKINTTIWQSSFIKSHLATK